MHLSQFTVALVKMEELQAAKGFAKLQSIEEAVRLMWRFRDLVLEMRASVVCSRGSAAAFEAVLHILPDVAIMASSALVDSRGSIQMELREAALRLAREAYVNVQQHARVFRSNLFFPAEVWDPCACA